MLSKGGAYLPNPEDMLDLQVDETGLEPEEREEDEDDFFENDEEEEAFTA